MTMVGSFDMKSFLVVIFVTLYRTNASACPAKCSCTGATVNCYLKQLGYIPENFPPSTTSLDLSYNELIALDGPLCQQVPELVELNLRGNSISQIPNGFFTDCKKLENLNIEHNKLFNINPEAFRNQTSLKTLNVHDNRIHNIDSDICQIFPALEHLIVGSNPISQIENSTLSSCVQLKTLNLHGSRILDIPTGLFDNCSSLEVIYFGRNRISTLRNDSFLTCENLKTLSFSENRIEEVEDNVFKKCVNLEVLDMSQNSISVVQQDLLRGCLKLKNLNLRKNQISEIEEDVFTECVNLKAIDLSSNNIRELQYGVFNGCTNLTSIVLSHNNIKVLQYGVFIGCSSLASIDLTYSNINEIHNGTFTECVKLEKIELMYNSITVLEAGVYKGCHSLTQIDLRYSKIVSIQEGAFTGCGNLDTLDLSNNWITDVEDGAFTGSENVTNLYLQDNKISYIHHNAFRGLESMRVLYLSNNLLSEGGYSFLLSCGNVVELHLQSTRKNESHLFIKDEDFRHMKKLEKLYIDRNQLSDFDTHFFRHAVNLYYITMTENLLSELDFDFCQLLPSLKLLDLKSNQISNISENFFTDCSTLTNLDIEYNVLSRIYEHTFTGLSKLQLMKLRNNNISMIHPDAFRNVTSLSTLYISDNPLSTGGYGFLRHCRNLATLYMVNTRDNERHPFITRDDINPMEKMQYLYISHNNVNELDPYLIHNMPNLLRLEMQYNKLSVIKTNTFHSHARLYRIFLGHNNIWLIEKNAFGDNPHLRNLYLENNPLHCNCSILSFWNWRSTNKYIISNAMCSNGTYVTDLTYFGLIRCNSSVPFVEAELLEGESFPIPNFDFAPSLQPVFNCLSEDMKNGSNLFDVYWYINTDLIISKFNQSIDDEESTILRAEEWINTHSMNMQVQCAVRMKNSTESEPGPFIYSPTVFAGLVPDKYEYTVLEGESIIIRFTATVPVGCISSNDIIRSHCDQPVYVFQPKYSGVDVSCTNGVFNRDVVFEAEFCGLRIKSLNWTEKKELTVYGFSDGIYNFKGRTAYIRLSTSSVSRFNTMWTGLNISDIKVTIFDKDSVVANRLCQIHNDPHVRTFDGTVYDYMEVGEFIMYKNDKGPYLVNVLFSSCGNGMIGTSCNCGVAIRSRNSLFVFRTCQSISKSKIHPLQQPVIRQYNCDANDMFIEQSKNSYKITLPHGTEVKFSVYTWSRFISGISIKPSVYDLDDARGLCGVPNTIKDKSDDFTHRQNYISENEKEFGDSWRITSNMTDEQLFVETPTFLVVGDGLLNEENSTVRQYCACEKQAGSTDNIDDFYTLHCNLTDTTEFCKDNSKSNGTSRTFSYTSCYSTGIESRRRRRRSTSESDDHVDFEPLIYDEDIYSNKTVEPATFRNGWTYEKAYNVCSEAIQNALPRNLYESYVEVPTEYFIETCVKDTEVSGDTTFLADTVAAMTTLIITEVLRNESLFSQDSKDDSKSVLEYITSQMCPNNCSENGNCISGICTCAVGYGGEDCSIDLSNPPINISLPDSGLCNLRTRSCRRTNIYGDFPSTTVWSYLKHFKIEDNIIVNTSEETIGLAEYRNMFMVTVTFPYSRRKRSANKRTAVDGYEISLSNDGVNYGDSVTIIIFHDVCFSCNFTSESFYCIDLGTCYKTDNAAKVPDTNIIMIAVGTSTCVLLFIVIAVIIKQMCLGSKRSKVFGMDHTENENMPNNKDKMEEFWFTRSNTISDLEFEIDEFQNVPPKVEILQRFTS